MLQHISKDKNYCFIEKYKPNNINELIYCNDFKQVLKSLLQMDYINILLKGEQCCGKTTIIDCILKEYYETIDIYNKHIQENLYYYNCLNDQGINGFRNMLKTFCQTKSTFANKKKFVIIDDIDILNEQSQQIIRSNMDKYGNQINFITSCTNINKVIDTLQSRLNILKIPKISKQNLKIILQCVIQTETFTMTKEAQEFIIKISDNSINILLNNLKKCSLLQEKQITIDILKNLCCQICYDYYDKYFHEVFVERNSINAIQILESLCTMGYSVIDILENLFSYVKFTSSYDDMFKFKLLPYICKYIDIVHTTFEDIQEIILFTFEIMYSSQLTL